ncbi:hypothetical protein JRQ81_015856 [Phrynocephalus forsythii]|uniref:Uncharacterized protein n=1 Tax=Phrynocephalus forsythii TaxID=171643 RepID=A0A9Q0XXD1_9SAUR|nr:hypothetical protein JRQ81_015856 [Phrynocephalus forsythii]
MACRQILPGRRWCRLRPFLVLLALAACLFYQTLTPLRTRRYLSALSDGALTSPRTEAWHGTAKKISARQIRCLFPSGNLQVQKEYIKPNPKEGENKALRVVGQTSPHSKSRNAAAVQRSFNCLGPPDVAGFQVPQTLPSNKDANIWKTTDSPLLPYNRCSMQNTSLEVCLDSLPLRFIPHRRD